MDSPIDVNNQSIEIAPGVRTSHFSPDGNVDNMPRYMYEDAKTCYESFLRGLRVSDNGPFLGHRTGPNQEYAWLSYKEIHEQALNVGSALLSKGCGHGDFVGIFASNSVGWVVTDLACAAFSLVSVPLYDTLGKESITYILHQTEAKVVLVGDLNKAKALLQDKENTQFIKCIILIEQVTQDLRTEADTLGIEILSLADMMDFGSNNLKDPQPGKPSDLHTICYTSGTTGNPKGVMLTNENIMSNLAGLLFNINTHVPLTTQDVHISYLPLAHLFERMAQVGVFTHGGRIGFYGGDPRKLIEDIGELRPSLFMAVPRVLNKIYDKILQEVSQSMIKSFLFNIALNRKMNLLRSGVVTQDTFWDMLVFRKIQALFGGRLRLIIAGSAPLAADVIDFFRAALGCSVLEGYGQSEITAGATIQIPTETSGGTVGPPMACCLVKLIDVPDMDCFVKDNKGEVCVKGPSVMQGYFKDEERTKEALDSEGWIHTGDIGQWMPNGVLKIIDRRKHIFKLSQGEYVSPERVENIYIRSQYVAQAFVEGKSMETCIVGIIVPDPEVIQGLAKNLGVQGDIKDICQNLLIKEAIFKELTKMGKEGGLNGFEMVKAIHLHPEPFSIDNGLLTPTFKTKRPVLRKFFSTEIDQLYTNLNKS